MALREIHNFIKATKAFNIQEITTDTTTVGNIIDTTGFNALEFVISGGNDLDATTVFTPKIEESTDITFATDVTDVDIGHLVGTTNVIGDAPSYEPPLTPNAVTASNRPIEDATFSGVADRNICKRIGVIFKKPYVRLSIVTTLKTTGGTMTADAILGESFRIPTEK